MRRERDGDKRIVAIFVPQLNAYPGIRQRTRPTLFCMSMTGAPTQADLPFWRRLRDHSGKKYCSKNTCAARTIPAIAQLRAIANKFGINSALFERHTRSFSKIQM